MRGTWEIGGEGGQEEEEPQWEWNRERAETEMGSLR